MASSWTRYSAHVPCLGRLILIHCATRGVIHTYLINTLGFAGRALSAVSIHLGPCSIKAAIDDTQTNGHNCVPAELLTKTGSRVGLGPQLLFAFSCILNKIWVQSTFFSISPGFLNLMFLQEQMVLVSRCHPNCLGLHEFFQKYMLLIVLVAYSSAVASTCLDL